MVMSVSIIAGLISAVIAAVVARALIPLGQRIGLVDDPAVAHRKVHKKPTVLIGGVGIFISVVVTLVGAHVWVPEMLPLLSAEKWGALTTAAIIIFIVGTIDDRFDLRPRTQLIGPVVAAVLVCAAGIVVSKITNPAGGIISFAGVPVVAGALTFMWLMGMMYSTKLLDGLDGLSAGLSGIGALVIFGLTQTQQYYEPRIGFLALIFAGACLGFLTVNFYPARAFLGEGGSLFMGFSLAILSILSGSKIATALLVMGLPVIDVARVIISRKLRGVSITRGDDQHLHHLLLANGFSHRGAVLLYYAAGLVFGVLALFLQSKGKIMLLIILAIVGIVGAQLLRGRLKKKI